METSRMCLPTVGQMAVLESKKSDVSNLAQKSLRATLYSSAKIPSERGDLTFSVYHNNSDSHETLVITAGELNSNEPVFVRVHSECITSEVFGSLKCDCKFQLDLAMDSIAKRGAGVLIYLRQEGRGIGLGNKIKAYALQNKGFDTVKANHALGFPSDGRDFTLAAVILRELGVSKILLNTNNECKVAALQARGIDVAQVIPSLAPLTEHNHLYMKTKLLEMGHRLESLFAEIEKTP